MIPAAVVYLAGWWINRSWLGFALRIIGMTRRWPAMSDQHGHIKGDPVHLGLCRGACRCADCARYTYIEPNGGSLEISFIVVIMALFMNRPVVGADRRGDPVALLQEYINANYSSYSTLVAGIAFLVIVYFLPKGVVGRIEQLSAKQRRSTW